MMIEPKSKTIADIFNSSDARLIVPKYQRKYEWGISHVQDLLNDVSDSMGEIDRQVFLGNFIFDVSKSGEYAIIDGQQRITTISIVLIAARQKARELGAYSLESKLQSDLTFTDIVGEEQGNRIEVSSSISNLFDYMVHSDWQGDFPDTLKGETIRRQRSKIKPIYDEIYKFIERFNINELISFVKSLKESYVILLQFSNQNDVYDIFERTNARGLDLNISDLLKNHIFSQGIELYEDIWTKIYTNADGTLPRLLKYFWISRRGFIRTKDLYRNLIQYGKEIGIAQFVEELLKFSKFYKAINTPSKDNILEWLQDTFIDGISSNESNRDEMISVFWALDLFNIKQPIPVIFSICENYIKNNEKPIKKLLNVLSVLEKYHFNNNVITNRVGNEVEKLYAEWARKFYETDNLGNEIDLFVQELRNKKTSEAEFVSRFIDLSYEDGEGMIAYVFDKINNIGLKGAQKYVIYNPGSDIGKRNLNIEHIFSQNYRKDENISDEDKEMIDNIGNLLIISRHTNSTLGSKSVEEKIEILSEPQHSGTLKYLNDFFDFYKKVGPNRGKEQITLRALELAKLAYQKIWNF